MSKEANSLPMHLKKWYRNTVCKHSLQCKTHSYSSSF